MEPMSMLLAGLGSQVLPDLYRWGKDQLFGPGPQDPNVQAQQNYLQQIQQPINMGMGNRQQQMINDFQQNLIPGMQEQFAGAGGMRSSAFGQQMGSALGNLQTNLGALGEENDYRNQQLNLQRLGELRGHLGQQQGFGLQAQDMGNRFNLGMLGAANNRQGNLANLLGAMNQQGMRPQFETINRPGQNAGGLDYLTRAAQIYLNMNQ